MTDEDTTHFGYSRVRRDEKAGLVRNVFDSVSNKYDLMNDLMSFGIHRLWKRTAVMLSNVRDGDQVLDLAGGTGDLTRLYLRRVGSAGQIVLADINRSMLQVGRDRLIDQGLVTGIRYVQVNAEDLPFQDKTFDCISIAFGLRNVTDKNAALLSMFRTLKPGGRAIILEFSQPRGQLLKKAYHLYSFRILPILGKIAAGDADSYRYLAESIRMHPGQQELAEMMKSAGFERCQYFNLNQGIVAVHRGYRL